jgi:hypothetical protein
MDIYIARSHLANNADTIQSLLEGINQDFAIVRPSQESWSFNEVINHLYDEEREDFREHLDWILHRSNENWPSIDPQAWVTARNYNERNFQMSLTLFLQERKKSLAWLESLQNFNWQKSGKAPWGLITAGDMLAAWVAHDLLHIRQLVELKWDLTKRDMAPYSVGYAGDW